MFDEFFSKGQELWERGESFATATVVRAEKPTSGKPGDKAIVTADGRMFGWIGGSCAQPTVIDEALRALSEDRSRFIRLSPEGATGVERVERGGLTELPMTCFSGGTMEIYIEPHQPRTRLLIVGGQHVAQALAHLGRAMGYEIVSVVPEGDDGEVEAADRRVDTLESLPEHVNRRTYVVVATHGHYDELALVPALRSEARYVGLVASRKRSESVLEYLRGRGFTDEAMESLHVPAGLDIGARRGDEIALSILAEIVQHHRSRERAEAEAAKAAEEAVETAVDPLCGMSVKVEGASHTHEHQGTTYYFCCGGCQARFAADPEGYLEAASS